MFRSHIFLSFILRYCVFISCTVQLKYSVNSLLTLSFFFWHASFTRVYYTRSRFSFEFRQEAITERMYRSSAVGIFPNPTIY